MAFHDVPSPPWPGVVQFWEELRQTHDVEERIAETQPSYGIGVVRIS